MFLHLSVGRIIKDLFMPGRAMAQPDKLGDVGGGVVGVDVGIAVVGVVVVGGGGGGVGVGGIGSGGGILIVGIGVVGIIQFFRGG
jgi:hypothetical protein